jgi:hypothetical protein
MDILGLLKRARTHEIVAEAASVYYNNDEHVFADELMELAVALKAILERAEIVEGTAVHNISDDRWELEPSKVSPHRLPATLIVEADDDRRK